MWNEPLPRANVEMVVVTVSAKGGHGTRTFVLDDDSSIEIDETADPLSGKVDITLRISGSRLR